jgi:hypothetical protein
MTGSVLSPSARHDHAAEALKRPDEGRGIGLAVLDRVDVLDLPDQLAGEVLRDEERPLVVERDAEERGLAGRALRRRGM